MITARYVSLPCSYQQTLRSKGGHQHLLIVTKPLKSESAADFSLQKEQNMKQVGRQESDNYVACKQAVLNILLIADCGRQRLEIFS